jgi:hypothetical protein
LEDEPPGLAESSDDEDTPKVVATTVATSKGYKTVKWPVAGPRQSKEELNNFVAKLKAKQPINNNNSENMRKSTNEVNQDSMGIQFHNSNMFPIPIEREGNCFFKSMEYYFRSNTGNSDLELRDLVCDHILYNQLDEICGITIRNLMILNAREAFTDIIGNSNWSDSDLVKLYIHKLRRTDGWAETLEIIAMADLKGVQILVFATVRNQIKLRQRYGTRVPGKVPKVVMLHFKDSHYEPMNITDNGVLAKILSTASLSNLEGDVMDDSDFIYKLQRFSDFSSYSKQRRIAESGIAKDPELVFDAINGFNFRDFHEEELLEDRKFLKEFCMLTVGDNSQIQEPGGSKSIDNSVAGIIDQLKSAQSGGAESLRKRRPKEVDDAIEAEIKQMHDKAVWEYLSPDDMKNRNFKDKRPIPVIMLEKEKFDSQGNYIKTKARAVALGNQQAVLETWSKEAPTASIQSFYIIIFLASKFNIRLESKDVTGAFLNADLPEDETEIILLSRRHAEIACKLNPSLKRFRRNDGSLLAKLLKCLYGLQQSPRKWYLRIRALLIKLGLKASEHDSCLFYMFGGSEVNYLLLFVDDMLIAFQSASLKIALTEELNKAFGEVSEQTGDVISFLGITIRQTEEFISLDQEGFITKLKDSLKLDKIPTYTNPVKSDFKVCQERFLKKQIDADPARLKLMRQLTMAVMYCAQRTRRDVLFATSFLASITCPEVEDIAAIKRVIVYLFNTIGKRQFFYREGAIKIVLFGDASHNLFADAKGQQCEMIYGDERSAALDMSSNKEKAPTSASFESELIVMNKTTDKGLLTSSIFTELRVPHDLPLTLYCDNEAAVLTASQEHINKMGRTKFMNRQLFHLHDKVVDGSIAPTWISSPENNADVGTKNLMGSHYDYLANRTFTQMHGASPYGPDPPICGGSATNNNNQFSKPSSVKADESEPKIGRSSARANSSHKSTDTDTASNSKSSVKTGGAAVTQDSSKSSEKIGGAAVRK